MNNLLLQTGFYTIVSEETNGSTELKTRIRFNAGSEVFKGHFPEFPVVPGVCLLEIVKELISSSYKSKILIKAVAGIKYLSVINPLNTPEVIFHIVFGETDGKSCSANIYVINDSTVYMKANKLEFFIGSEQEQN